MEKRNNEAFDQARAAVIELLTNGVFVPMKQIKAICKTNSTAIAVIESIPGVVREHKVGNGSTPPVWGYRLLKKVDDSQIAAPKRGLGQPLLRGHCTFGA